MGRRAKILLACLGVFAVRSAYTHARFTSDLAAAEKRVTGQSAVVDTRHGRLEYAVAGSGPPLLMIHGTGGGFDQGLTFTEGLLPHNFRIVAPSRFGYLRSDFPDDPSSEKQADAFVDLLDHLGIERLAVAGGSAGALSAVQFALRHPERSSALILIVPAANVRGTDPAEMSCLGAALTDTTSPVGKGMSGASGDRDRTSTQHPGHPLKGYPPVCLLDIGDVRPDPSCAM